MSFELFVPRTRIDAITPGKAAVNGTGSLKVHASDLRRAGISGASAVLVDRSTKRIALRPPNHDEPAVTVRLTKSKTSGDLNIRGLLADLGLDPKRVKGRYDVMQKENLLIVQLADRPAAK